MTKTRAADVIVTDDFQNCDIEMQSDQVQNPDWALFVETDQEEAFRSRVKLLSRLARTRTLTLSYHEQFPGLGYIIERGPFFDWQTASVYSVNKCMGSSC